MKEILIFEILLSMLFTITIQQQKKLTLRFNMFNAVNLIYIV